MCKDNDKCCRSDLPDDVQMFITMRKMELHEDSNVDAVTNVLRVPGGWIYKFYDFDGEKIESTTFVPFC